MTTKTFHRDQAFDAAREEAGGELDLKTFLIVHRALSAVGMGDEAVDARHPPKGTQKPSGRRTINKAGRELIQSFEGLRLSAYKDAVGVWTIGWGHTDTAKPGMTITKAEAEGLFDMDLRRFEEAVARKCPVATDNQFAAMVSLAFNVGVAAFDRSTLAKQHAAGNYKLAQLQFARWVFAGGQKLAGLVRRRTAEAKLYGTPDQ